MLLCIAGLCWLLNGTAWGQHVPADQVDAIFAEWNRTDSPGCALSVIQEGKVVYEKGYGMASLEHSVPITPNTVFYAGSVSKQFVAMAVALLAERGALSFDDDIRVYVPEIPAYERPITIRHLIHHTSGLRDYLQLSYLAGKSYLDAMDEAEVLDLIARQEALNFAPGDQYLYSNSGYFLLAEIVKRVSGQSFRAFTNDHMLKPLGMEDSHFHDDNTMMVPRRADGYFRRADGQWGAMTMRFALVGSGGLYTTVSDLYRWDQNFYHNRLGNGTQALIDTTLTRGVLSYGDTLSYAFAVDVETYRGAKTIRHGGALGGYRAHLVRFPKQAFSTALLCNLANVNPEQLANRVADLYLAKHLAPSSIPMPTASNGEHSKREAASVDPAIYADYVGQYVDARGVVIRFTEADGQLVLEWPGLPRITLLPESETVYFQHFDEDRFAFRRNEDGSVARVVVLREQREIPFRRVPTYSEDELAAYAGTYHGDELQVAYHLHVEAGQLYLRIQHQAADVVTLIDSEKGQAEVGMLHFEQDESGKVLGFTLSSGRVRGLRFVRNDE